jgi:hypothetical protein
MRLVARPDTEHRPPIAAQGFLRDPLTTVDIALPNRAEPSRTGSVYDGQMSLCGTNPGVEQVIYGPPTR